MKSPVGDYLETRYGSLGTRGNKEWKIKPGLKIVPMGTTDQERKEYLGITQPVVSTELSCWAP